MHYDPAIIIQFAQRLYRRADGILISYTLLLGLLGLLVGVGVGMVAGGMSDALTYAGVLGIFTGLLGAAFGYVIGKEKGFALRLQAQIALCQVQIESNTRAAPGAGQYGPRAA